MFKSINQWSFPATMSVEQMMRLAKAQGFAGFEPSFSPEASDQEVMAIGRAAKEIGIALVSLASGGTWSCSPTANCAKTREKAHAQALRQLECAHMLGVDAILLVPGTVGVGFWGADDPVEYDDCWTRASENIAALQPQAEALGVTIGVENVWNNFLMSPLEMRAFIDQFNSPRVGVYLDVGNIVRYGMPESWVRILDKRICRVHVKDYKRAVGTLDGFVDLLCGDVNYPAVIAALQKIGYDGPLTAEMNAGYSVYHEDVIYRTARALELILGERE